MKNESTFSCSGEPVTTTAQWVKSQIKNEEIEKYLKDGKDFIDDEKIERLISEKTNPTREKIEEILERAMDIKLLSDEDTAYLVNVKDKELRDLVFEAAKKIKFKVYDNRIVTFAPLYLGSKCVNNCKYCGFRCSNNEIERRVLTMEEVRKETQVLCGKIGHKRLVVVTGNILPPAAITSLSQ